MSGHSVIDWRLCIICQKTSSEDLCCPILGSIDATVYSALWRSSENLVVCLLKSTSAIKLGINFVHNKDSWHKQCHQKFNTLMLKRMQLKRRRESMVSIEGEDSCMALMALSCSSFRVRWPDANLSRAYSIASSKHVT